mmetsp:Transcript_29831/g.50287  ORF Transcript_29831/g.50287 Transcript_29831/m.50287 type:complete len:230 (-) Transcript_29831:143-832(-)
MICSATAHHGADSIHDGTIHQMGPPSRKRSFVESCKDSDSTLFSKRIDQKSLPDCPSVGAWNGNPVSTTTALSLNTAAHSLGLLTQTIGSTSVDFAPCSPRPASELDWDYVFGVFSSTASAVQQKRRKDVPDKGFDKCVNAFLAVGAWNEIVLDGKPPSREELQHAASILGLCSRKNNDIVGWTTVEALLGDPMHARTPSPSSKLAAAKTAGEVTFGSSSIDCIAMAMM